MTIPVADLSCPYRGLQPYTEADRAYFFGRERDREVIISNLYASHLTVLYGSSGVGKSSVLMAGVLPQLQQLPRVVTVMWRDWQDARFETSLKTAIITAAAAASGRDMTVGPDAPLDEILVRAAAAVRGVVFLVFDQFEEYFLYHRPSDAADRFEAELARVVNRADVEAHVLLALREEGLSRLDRFGGRIPNLFRNIVRLEHLDRDAGREAVRRPLAVFHQRHPDAVAPAAIEDALVEALLDDARPGTFRNAAQQEARTVPGEPRTASDRVETPLLQMVLTRLWASETAAASGVLRLATYDALGRARGIAATYVDEMMALLSDPERETAARILRFLVTPSETKVAHEAAVVAAWAEVGEDEVTRVLVRLASPELRILRTVESPHQPTRYEIFHDVLAPALLDWRRRHVEQLAYERIRREADERRVREADEARRQEEIRRAAARARVVRAALAAAVLVTVALAALTTMTWMQRNRARAYLAQAREESARANREREAARAASALAEQRLRRIVESMELKRAALAGDPAALDRALSAANSPIRFGARAVPYGYRNSAGQPVYRFELYPDAASIPGGLSSIAFITYKMEHQTFRNTLMLTGPDRGFAASYDGWGCLTRVIAVIEYANPDQAPDIVQFNMCQVLGW